MEEKARRKMKCKNESGSGRGRRLPTRKNWG
jgi:hypothetical protein